jgi:hypothetical protein
VVIRAALGMVIVANTACSYGVSFRDCEVACISTDSQATPGSGCPAGFTCSPSEGLCRSGAITPSCLTILDGGVDASDGGGIDGGVGSDGGVGIDGSVDGGSASCPAAFGGGRYLFVNMLVTWTMADMYCKGLDSNPGDATYVHLVVLSDASELGLLAPPSVCGQPADDQCKPWLGYSDGKLNGSGLTPDPSKFLWVTDEAGIVTWAAGQPDETEPPRCAYRDADGLVHDRTCDHTRSFFCECDQFPEDASHL